MAMLHDNSKSTRRRAASAIIVWVSQDLRKFDPPYYVPFNWNISILVGNDYWTCQEAVCTNKPPFTIMSSIFEVYGKGVTL